jgi:hypothetical protein
MARTLTLLTRAYCHLCDDMRAALAPIVAGHDVVVAEFDVDADPALEAAFGDDVPALIDGQPGAGVLLSRWRLDVENVRRALAPDAKMR